MTKHPAQASKNPPRSERDPRPATERPHQPTGCHTCDQHGPELPTWQADVRELHRAWHDLGRALTEPLERPLAWLNRRLIR